MIQLWQGIVSSCLRAGTSIKTQYHVRNKLVTVKRAIGRQSDARWMVPSGQMDINSRMLKPELESILVWVLFLYPPRRGGAMSKHRKMDAIKAAPAGTVTSRGPTRGIVGIRSSRPA